MNGMDKIDGSELGKHPGMNHRKAKEWPGDTALACRCPTDPHPPWAATKTLLALATGWLTPPPPRGYGETLGCSLLPKQFNNHLEDNHDRFGVSCVSATPSPGRSRGPRDRTTMAMEDAGRGDRPCGPNWGAKHTGECTQGCKVPPQDTSVLILAIFRDKTRRETSPNSSAAKEAAATLEAAAPAAFTPLRDIKSTQDSS